MDIGAKTTLYGRFQRLVVSLPLRFHTTTRGERLRKLSVVLIGPAIIKTSGERPEIYEFIQETMGI